MKILLFFHVPGCSGMFRHVTECSGMFRNGPCSGFYRCPRERQYFSVLAIIIYESVALDSGVYVIKDSFRP